MDKKGNFQFIDWSVTGAEIAFRYGFEKGPEFTETITLPVKPDVDQAFQSAGDLAHLILGVSYYKAWPSQQVRYGYEITADIAQYLNLLYREGLGQFAYQNNLDPRKFTAFEATDKKIRVKKINTSGTLLMQSGGKDSLLSATLLHKAHKSFSQVYISSTDNQPLFTKALSKDNFLIKRDVDIGNLNQAQEEGAYNGHIPVTAINSVLSLLLTICLKRQQLVISLEASTEEPTGYIGKIPVNHQFAKTLDLEKMLAGLIKKNIASDIDYISLIRPLTELKCCQLFVATGAWNKFKYSFASCNIANYRLGHNAESLQWCGKCPKCANSFLLFAPWVSYEELIEVFGGKNLLLDPKLQQTYLAMFGIEGKKPFECVSDIQELRLSYYLAIERDARYKNPAFTFEKPDYDFESLRPAQLEARSFLLSVGI